MHLHKSFVELHFAGRSLPQNVSVVGCVDGKQLSTVLPGQVREERSTSRHNLNLLRLRVPVAEFKVLSEHLAKGGGLFVPLL